MKKLYLYFNSKCDKWKEIMKNERCLPYYFDCLDTEEFYMRTSSTREGRTSLTNRKTNIKSIGSPSDATPPNDCNQVCIGNTVKI